MLASHETSAALADEVSCYINVTCMEVIENDFLWQNQL